MLLNQFSKTAAIATVLSLSVSGAFAATITAIDGTQGWGVEGGNSAITTDAPRSGNGSLKLSGDRTRTIGLGNFYDSTSNLGLLSDVTSFGFEYRLDSASVSNYSADYTPALRLHIWDGSQRSELIWEGAYNGTYGNTTKDVWYFADMFGNDADKVYRWENGAGVTNINGALGLDTVSGWATGGLYSDSAYVSAISVGAGSGVGTSYFAFADNVKFGFDSSETTYNFENEISAVPVPASLPLLLGAFGLASVISRRKRRKA